MTETVFFFHIIDCLLGRQASSSLIIVVRSISAIKIEAKKKLRFFNGYIQKKISYLSNQFDTFFLMLVSFFFLAFRHSSYYYERIGRKTCEKKEKKKSANKKDIFIGTRSNDGSFSHWLNILLFS
jgi:hypothetical protein